MSPKRYRKKPVEVEAVQWTGENRGEVEQFAGFDLRYGEGDELIALWLPAGALPRNFWLVSDGGSLRHFSPGAFHATYEPVEEGDGEELKAKLEALHDDLRITAGAEAEKCESSPDPIAEAASDAYTDAANKVGALLAHPQLSTEEGETRRERERADRLEIECRELEDANRSLVKMRDAALEGNLATSEPEEGSG